MKQFKNMHKPVALLLALVMMLAMVPAAIAEGYSAFVSASSMPVYSSASLSSRIATLDEWTVFTVESSSSGIAKISYGSKTGYARTSYMTAVEDVAQPAVVNTTSKVYKSASSSSASMRLPAGMRVNVIQSGYKWSLIENGSGVGGYCYTSVLDIGSTATPTPAPTSAPGNDDPLIVYINRDCKVYQSASSSSKAYSVKEGMQVEYYGTSNGWALIRNPGNGMYAYCNPDFLSSEAPGADPTPVPTAKPTAAPTPTQKPDDKDEYPVTVYITEDTKVYKSASTSSKAYAVNKGMQVELHGVEGSWALIRNPGNGMYAYCNPAYLSVNQPDPDGQMMTINADTKVYKSASTSSKAYNVKKGMQVTVLEINGSWAYIENPANGVRAYVNVKYLDGATTQPTPTPTPDISNAVPAIVLEKIWIYSEPSTSGEQIGYLNAGTVINLVKTNGSWALIERNGTFGYCNASKLSTDLDSPMPTPTPTPKPNAYTMYVNANTNVYDKASTSGNATGVKLGTAVTVLEVDGSWAYIENPANGARAYIQTKYLCTASELPTPDPFADWTFETFDATVVTTAAKFYTEASLNASSKSAAQGTTVTVTCYNDTWAYVTMSGTKGFILRTDLSRKQYAELTLGSTGSTVSTLEKTLLGLGYFDVVPNDTFDSYTQAAVKRLQAACGFTADGVATQALQRVLYSGNVPECSILSKSYSKGAENDDVERIQLRLYALDYYAKSSSVDGQYGSNTATAISNFQKANGLSQTGTADSATIRKLYSTGAVANSGGGADEGGGGTVVQPDPGNQQNGVTWISDSLASKTSKLPSGATNAEKLEYAIYLAQNQLGKKYVWGTEGPNTYDCTGLTYMAFKALGITLPRTAVNQGYNEKYTRIYDISSLRRGDIVYFNTVSDNDLSDHAGIYLGAGWFIHASSGGGHVQINTLNSGYYNRVFSWGHHILPT